MWPLKSANIQSYPSILNKWLLSILISLILYPFLTLFPLSFLLYHLERALSSAKLQAISWRSSLNVLLLLQVKSDCLLRTVLPVLPGSGCFFSYPMFLGVERSCMSFLFPLLLLKICLFSFEVTRSFEAFAFISHHLTFHLPLYIHDSLFLSSSLLCVILGVVNIRPTPGLFIPISYYLSLYPSLATSSCGHTPEPVVTNNCYFCYFSIWVPTLYLLLSYRWLAQYWFHIAGGVVNIVAVPASLFLLQKLLKVRTVSYYDPYFYRTYQSPLYKTVLSDVYGPSKIKSSNNRKSLSFKRSFYQKKRELKFTI